MTESVGKDINMNMIKVQLINTFKKIEESMSLLRTNMGDIKKAQLPILRDIKITTF